MRKLLLAFVILLLGFSWFSAVKAQAPESVLIRTEHYIQDAAPPSSNFSDIKIHLDSEKDLLKSGKPKWIRQPECEETEFYWVHGISRCGCDDGDDNGNGYSDFDYAWKLKVPSSGKISLQYAQACCGGDSVEIFVSSSVSGPWTKIFTIEICSYCSYSWNSEQPYYIDLTAAGLSPESEYYLRVLSGPDSIDIFKLEITAQAEINVQESSWGAVKSIYH
ncbi:MAG: hypothetical protein U5L76_05090 [Patescibacteria group bacterium]|nr:hypothetical protein [Patescibacteria group bacterium]